MTLYVSNPSKQTLNLNYREPHEDLPARHNRMLAIGAGREEAVPGSAQWNSKQKGDFISQIETYGAHDAAEVHSHITRFSGPLYRDGGLISEDEILMGHDQRVATQELISAEEATRGALGFDRASQSIQKGRQRTARVTGVEVQRERAHYERPSPDDVTFSMEVNPEGGTNIKLPV